MSSLVRRLQIREMKRRGYERTLYKLVKNARGDWEQYPVRRGGIILDPDNKPIGYQWPRFIPRTSDEALLSRVKPRSAA